MFGYATQLIFRATIFVLAVANPVFSGNTDEGATSISSSITSKEKSRVQKYLKRFYKPPTRNEVKTRRALESLVGEERNKDYTWGGSTDGFYFAYGSDVNPYLRDNSEFIDTQTSRFYNRMYDKYRDSLTQEQRQKMGTHEEEVANVKAFLDDRIKAFSTRLSLGPKPDPKRATKEIIKIPAKDKSIVYRGVSADDSSLRKSIRPGDVIHQKAFTSATVDRETALEWKTPVGDKDTNLVLIISDRKNGVYMGDVYTHFTRDNAKTHFEYLFPKDQFFEVLGTKTKTSKNGVEKTGVYVKHISKTDLLEKTPFPRIINERGEEYSAADISAIQSCQ